MSEKNQTNVGDVKTKQRRRSEDRECRTCSQCCNMPHHWMLHSVADHCYEDHLDKYGEPDFSQDAIDVAGDAMILWSCKHCNAWMEVMPDDSEDETDFDAAWREAVEI